METAQDPKWLVFAKTLIGLQEVKDNTTIVGWAKELGDKFIAAYFTNAHTIPWCGLFMDYTQIKSGYQGLGDKALGAENWNTYGQPLSKGALGAILVFHRPGGGHVGYYIAEDSTTYHVLGGNQSDSVCITRVEKARCIGIRWPDAAVTPSTPIIVNPNGQPVSNNEE